MTFMGDPASPYFGFLAPTLTVTTWGSTEPPGWTLAVGPPAAGGEGRVEFGPAHWAWELVDNADAWGDAVPLVAPDVGVPAQEPVQLQPSRAIRLDD